jgi:hypothetical protein
MLGKIYFIFNVFRFLSIILAVLSEVGMIPLQKAPFECPYCRSTSGHGGENQSKIESEQGLKPTYWVHQ